jgi:divalent metal cation (Fe/Co/Zn/Cd) transporter
MGESGSAAQSLIGPTKVNHLAQDLWCMILVLACSYAVYQFCRHRSERLGIVLCLLVAAAAMTWHSL